MIKVICAIEKNKYDVQILGGHLRKRELLLLIRAIKQAYRNDIRLFRNNLLAENAKRRVEADNVVEQEVKKNGNLGETKNAGHTITRK